MSVTPRTVASGGMPPELRDVPMSWPVSASTDLHRDGWVVALRAAQVRRPGHPDEEPFRRIVMEHPGAAVVLAVSLVLVASRNKCYGKGTT